MSVLQPKAQPGCSPVRNRCSLTGVTVYGKASGMYIGIWLAYLAIVIGLPVAVAFAIFNKRGIERSWGCLVAAGCLLGALVGIVVSFVIAAKNAPPSHEMFNMWGAVGAALIALGIGAPVGGWIGGWLSTSMILSWTKRSASRRIRD